MAKQLDRAAVSRAIRWRRLSSLPASSELEGLLASCYEEMLLNDVYLPDEAHLAAQSQLIDLRYFSRHRGKIRPDRDYISQRVQLLLRHIKTLTDSFAVDAEFVYTATFTVHSINTLKNILKSTYNALPWEEIEYCLASFVSAHSARHPSELHHLFVPKKRALLEDLRQFGTALQKLEGRISCTPVRWLRRRALCNRDMIVAIVTAKNLAFSDLYRNFEEVRDVHSLNIMEEYSRAGAEEDCTTREGRLSIKRSLQVVGEHLRNALNAPKLSTYMSDLLLFAVPRDTRIMLQKLRDSSSPSNVIQTEILEDSASYSDVQNHMKIFASVVHDISVKIKISKMKALLKDFYRSYSFTELKHVLNLFSKEMDPNIVPNIGFDPSTNIKQRIVLLVDEIDEIVTTKTEYENKLLSEICFTLENFNPINDDAIFFLGIRRLLALSDIDLQRKESVKRFISRIVHSNSDKSATEKIQQDSQLICNLLEKFYQSAVLKMPSHVAQEVFRLILKIQLLVLPDCKNINLITKHIYNDSIVVQEIGDQQPINKYQNIDIIVHKLHELRELMKDGNNNNSQLELEDNFYIKKSAIEAILLEILTLLDESKVMSDDSLFLDEINPVLIGKSLKNYLAHNCASVNLMLSNHTKSVQLNMIRLCGKTIIPIYEKVGHVVLPNFEQLEKKYECNLKIISTQQEMCRALLQGNLQSLKEAIAREANIYSRSKGMKTMLHLAAQGSDLQTIKFLLKNGLKEDVKDARGQTPLHVAAYFGKTDTVRHFIKKSGASIEDPDDSGRTPLHLASCNGHTETAVALLKLGADHTAKDARGKSAVHLALENDFLDLVKVLIGKDKTVNENRISAGFTCLHLAAELGLFKIVEYLIEENADVNAEASLGVRPIHLASLYGHLGILKALIRSGAQVNCCTEDGSSALHNAVASDCEQSVRLLLESGADMNYGNSAYKTIPLNYAISNGNKKIVGLLLEYKADVSITTPDGFTPLLYAAKTGYCEIVDLLLQKGSPVNSKLANGWSALHIAAFHGWISMVMSFIKWGLDIEAVDKKGCTPLHLAASQDHYRVVQVLLAAKANIQCFNLDFLTPLHCSIIQGHQRISKYLLSKGANVNASSGPFNKTPLHRAATIADSVASVKLLLKSGADVHLKCVHGCTALHLASFCGNSEIVEVLAQAGSVIDSRNEFGLSALEMAVNGNHNKAAEILMAYGADVNHIDDAGSTVLCKAAKNNNARIAKMLIQKGADANLGLEAPLYMAAILGHTLMVDTLLECEDIDMTVKGLDEHNVFTSAISLGHRSIVKAFVTKGYKVSKEELAVAVLQGRTEIVELILENGSDANYVTEEGDSMLHLTVLEDNPCLVQCLLNHGAKYDARNATNNTPFELAMAKSRMKNIQTIFQHIKQHGDSKSDESLLLHIAVEHGNEKVVNFLINHGADVHARNSRGFKAIHVAVREGHCRLLDLFLRGGLNTAHEGPEGATLLHHAAMTGQTAVARHLMNKWAGASYINLPTRQGQLPIHLSALRGNVELTRLFLANGAIYNYVDSHGQTPLDMTDNDEIKELFMSCRHCFRAVKKNDVASLQNKIRPGADYLNAKNSENSSLLHSATYYGFKEICDILLENEANPDAAGKGGCSPLHYAAKYSQFEIVKCLLNNGATYDLQNATGKTPLDFATRENVIQLFDFIYTCFRKAKTGNPQVVSDLYSIQDPEIVKAVLKCRSASNGSLMAVAMRNNLPKVEKLKQILQGNVARTIALVESLFLKEKYGKALEIWNMILNNKIQIFGRNDPSTLEVQGRIAGTLYQLARYPEALQLMESTHAKLVEFLSPDCPFVLNMKNMIALTLHKLHRNDEALSIFREVIPRQKEVMGEDHAETLSSLTNAALVLGSLGRYEECLALNSEVYEKRLRKLTHDHPDTLFVLHNSAMILKTMGEYDAALCRLQKIYKARKALMGMDHHMTLRTKLNIGQVLLKQGKTEKALKIFNEVFNLQKHTLGESHVDTLLTKGCISSLQSEQNSVKDSPKEVSDILLETDETTQIETDVELRREIGNELLSAASKGDTAAILGLIERGCPVDFTDNEGRSALHFAIDGNFVDVIAVLLNNGADVTIRYPNRDTTLHVATAKKSLQIVQLLVENVQKSTQDSYNAFLNAKTLQDGRTALHIAAQNDSADIVAYLIRSGCIYCEEQKTGLTPLQLSRGARVGRLLRRASGLFACAESGGTPRPSRATLPAAHCRDRQLRTPLQVAIAHGHLSLARIFTSMMKENITS